MPVIEGGQVLRGGQDFGGVLGGQVLYGGQEIEAEQGGRTQPDSEAVEMSVGPFRRSGAPPNGWYNGVADKGATAVDITTGTQYRNTGTKAATVWEAQAPSGGGSGETVVYGPDDIQPDGVASSWGPMTLPADKTVLELRISGGGAAAGQAFGLVLNGDTDSSHYGGAGVPGNPSFFTTADSANTTASFQIVCTIAHYRRVGRHVLPFLVAYDDRAADAVAFDTDRGSFRQVAALTSLTILSFDGAGVAAPFPSGTLIEVVAR